MDKQPNREGPDRNLRSIRTALPCKNSCNSRHSLVDDGLRLENLCKEVDQAKDLCSDPLLNIDEQELAERAQRNMERLFGNKPKVDPVARLVEDSVRRILLFIPILLSYPFAAAATSAACFIVCMVLGSEPSTHMRWALDSSTILGSVFAFGSILNLLLRWK